MSTTPIERGAEAICALRPVSGKSEPPRWLLKGASEDTRAVFESIPEHVLIDAMRAAEDEMVAAVRANLDAALAGEEPDPDASLKVYARALKAALLTTQPITEPMEGEL